jgi:hypothetical protein
MLGNFEHPFFDELKKIRAEINPTSPEDFSDLEKVSDEYIKALVEQGAKKRKLRISDLNKYMEELDEEDFDELALTLIQIFKEDEDEE